MSDFGLFLIMFVLLTLAACAIKLIARFDVAREEHGGVGPLIMDGLRALLAPAYYVTDEDEDDDAPAPRVVRRDTDAERTSSEQREPVRASVPAPAAPAQPDISRADDAEQEEPKDEDWRADVLADELIIDGLAELRRPDGKFRFGANQIATLVGGTRANVLDRVRRIQGEDAALFTTPDGERKRGEYPISGRAPASRTRART